MDQNLINTLGIFYKKIKEDLDKNKSTQIEDVNVTPAGELVLLMSDGKQLSSSKINIPKPPRDGQDGDSVVDAYISGENLILKTLSGVELNAGKLPKSEDGKDGRGIEKVSLTDKDDLVVNYTDGKSKVVGNLKAKDGLDAPRIKEFRTDKANNVYAIFTDESSLKLGKLPSSGSDLRGIVGSGLPLGGETGQILIRTDKFQAGAARWGDAPNTGVPYTGATDNLDLGSNNLITTGQIINRDTQSSMSHGVHNGCRVSIDVGDTEISISSGTYTIIDSWTDPQAPNIYDVTYSGASAISITGLASADYTYILLDKDGNIFQLTQYPNDEQRRTYVTLAQIEHPNRTTIAEINEITDVYASPVNLSRDALRIIGMINKGNVISPNGANLKFSRSAGSIFEEGVNFHVNNKRPNIIEISSEAESLFNRRTQTGLGDDDVDVLDVANYDVAGTITTVPSVGYTNQRVFLPPTGATVVQYGQVVYDTLAEAVAGVFSENFTALPSVVDHAILIGVISVASNATDLSNISQAVFIEAGKFGELIGGSKGTSTTTLQQAHDNSAVPRIVTSSSSGAVIFQRGSTDDSDVVVEGQNGAGSTTYSLTGDGVVTADTFVGGLAESNVVFTDITSNNASISKHGFMPKLSDVSDEFLNGKGVWTTISAGVSGVVEVPFTSQTSVNIVHNLGAYPVVQVLDSSGDLFVPLSVEHNTDNDFTVTFSTSETGTILYMSTAGGIAGGGDVVGSGVGVDNAIVRLNGTGGTTIQGSLATVDDDGLISGSGLVASNVATISDNIVHTGYGAQFNCTTGDSVIELTLTGGSSTGSGSNYTFGYEFTVGGSDIVVSELGIYSNGFVSASRRCGIWDTSGTLLTSVSVSSGVPDEGGHKYAAITPYTLTAGETYRIGAEFLAADTYHFSFATETFINVTYINPYANLGSSFAYPTSVLGPFFAGPNFKVLDTSIGSTTTIRNSEIKVYGEGDQVFRMERAESGYFDWEIAATIITSNSSFVIRGGADGDLTNSNALLTINNTDVGIGTTSPASKLHVYDSSNDEILVTFEGENTSDYQWMRIINNSDEIVDYGISPHGGAYIYNRSTLTAGERAFTVNGNNTEYMVIDYSGDTTFAGDVSCHGIDPDYVIYEDQKSTNVSGGSAIVGWQVRALNTLEAEKDTSGSFSALSSNQFTLQAGRYSVDARVPAYRIGRSKAVLVNVTDSTAAIVGTSLYALSSPSYGSIQACVHILGEIDISSAKTFEIQQYCEVASPTYGLGVEANASGYVEVYTQIKITRLGN